MAIILKSWQRSCVLYANSVCCTNCGRKRISDTHRGWGFHVLYINIQFSHLYGIGYFSCVYGEVSQADLYSKNGITTSWLWWHATAEKFKDERTDRRTDGRTDWQRVVCKCRAATASRHTIKILLLPEGRQQNSYIVMCTRGGRLTEHCVIYMASARRNCFYK